MSKLVKMRCRTFFQMSVIPKNVQVTEDEVQIIIFQMSVMSLRRKSFQKKSEFYATKGCVKDALEF